MFGEVGLTGEVRAVSQPAARVKEALKLGFARCIVPRGNLKALKEISGIEIVGVRDLRPKGAKIPKFFKRVYAKVGDVITFESLGVKGKKQMVEAMEKVAMDKVYELRDFLRAEHPGKM